jgi:hypothetical protein
MIKIEHDTATNIVTEIELSAFEIKEIEKLRKDEAKKNAVIEAEAEAIAIQRQAILDRLGLTSEEAALLLS